LTQSNSKYENYSVKPGKKAFVGQSASILKGLRKWTILGSLPVLEERDFIYRISVYPGQEEKNHNAKNL
jgi:hypothetical protein